MLPKRPLESFLIMILGLTALAVPFPVRGEKWVMPNRLRHQQKVGQMNEVSKGVFIVADPRIVDPNFSQTVILMLQHDDEGSLGLIVNRPSDTPLSQLIPKAKTDIALTDTLYVGGPVMGGTLTVLFRSILPPEHLSPIFGQVYASQEARVFAEKLESPGFQKDFRLFSGYAGWHPNQLREEIDRGDWRIVKADAEVIFDSPSESIWQEVFNRTQERRVQASAILIDS